MLTRIITGVVGIALAAVVIQLGGLLFAGFALALALVAWFEYTDAFAHRGLHLTFVLGAIGLVLIWGAGWLMNPELILAAVTLVVVCILLQSVLMRGFTNIMDSVTSIAGVLYIGLPFAYMVMMRDMNPETTVPTVLGNFQFGAAIIWIMFIGTWASDTFAYFVGSAIGSHKLCPTISPNKTIEGFFGSLVGTTVAVAGLGVFFALPVPEMAILGFVMAIFATLGDLIESVAKRYVRIKDSGYIIPGHGGVWDRFDSILLTAPLIYYFVRFVELTAR